MPSVPYSPVDPVRGAEITPESAEQQERGSAQDPPIITKQAALEHKKHVETQETPHKLATPEPDVPDRRPSTTECSPFHASPVTSYDEPQEHILNAAEQPIVYITDYIPEQHAGPSAPTTKHSFSHWLPSLLEMKQQLEQCVEDRLLRMSHLDPVRNIGHSLK